MNHAVWSSQFTEPANLAHAAPNSVRPITPLLHIEANGLSAFSQQSSQQLAPSNQNQPASQTDSIVIAMSKQTCRDRLTDFLAIRKSTHFRLV